MKKPIEQTLQTLAHVWASALVAAAAMTLAPASAAADSGFRCATGRLIDQGDHMYEVRKKCGEPDSISQRFEKRTVKQKVRQKVGYAGLSEEVDEEREVEVQIDEWLYDLGDRRFIRLVSFENNRVTDVATGNRGSR